jgi:phosphoserine aminotransferase
MVPFNLMKENGKAAYDTGTWSAGAIKKLNPLETVVVASSKKKITITFKRIYSTG